MTNEISTISAIKGSMELWEKVLNGDLSVLDVIHFHDPLCEYYLDINSFDCSIACPLVQANEWCLDDRDEDEEDVLYNQIRDEMVYLLTEKFITKDKDGKKIDHQKKFNFLVSKTIEILRRYND